MRAPCSRLKAAPRAPICRGRGVRRAVDPLHQAALLVDHDQQRVAQRPAGRGIACSSAISPRPAARLGKLSAKRTTPAIRPRGSPCRSRGETAGPCEPGHDPLAGQLAQRQRARRRRRRRAACSSPSAAPSAKAPPPPGREHAPARTRRRRRVLARSMPRCYVRALERHRRSAVRAGARPQLANTLRPRMPPLITFEEALDYGAADRATRRSERWSSAPGRCGARTSATRPTCARWSTPSPAAAPRTAASAPSRATPRPTRRCTR